MAVSLSKRHPRLSAYTNIPDTIHSVGPGRAEESKITARNRMVTRSFVAGCTRIELATSDATRRRRMEEALMLGKEAEDAA
jgi:hypothetical protein